VPIDNLVRDKVNNYQLVMVFSGFDAKNKKDGLIYQ